MAKALYPTAQARFCTILRYVARASPRIAAASSGLLRTRTMSAVSTATSVPAPIAMPTSAWARAGASFTPSPVMATTNPLDWISFTLLAFSWGNTSAKYSSNPISSATHLATWRLSPVSIMVCIPMPFNFPMACLDSLRIISARATAAFTVPSTSTNTTVFP